MINQVQQYLGFTENIKTAYKETFNNDNDSPKKVLKDLSEKFGLYQSAYSSDPCEMAKRCGQQEVILHILAMSANINDDVITSVEQFINQRS